jgi:hypothetical protein
MTFGGAGTPPYDKVGGLGLAPSCPGWAQAATNAHRARFLA